MQLHYCLPTFRKEFNVLKLKVHCSLLPKVLKGLTSFVGKIRASALANNIELFATGDMKLNSKAGDMEIRSSGWFWLRHEPNGHISNGRSSNRITDRSHTFLPVGQRL